MKHKNYHRLGWIFFDNNEHAAKALEQYNGHKMRSFDLHLSYNKTLAEFSTSGNIVQLKQPQPQENGNSNNNTTTTTTSDDSKINTNTTTIMFPKAKVAPPATLEPSRITTDLEQCKLLTRLLDQEKEIDHSKDNPFINGTIREEDFKEKVIPWIYI